MAQDVLLIKNLNRLEAAEPISAEIIEAIKQKEIVTATIRRARNPGHHRKFFALLKAVYESQSRYPSPHAVLCAIKLWTGHYDSFFVDGKECFVPKSISFANMGQGEFESFYNHAVKIILEKVLPGVVRQDLENRILEIMGNNYVAM